MLLPSSISNHPEGQPWLIVCAIHIAATCEHAGEAVRCRALKFFESADWLRKLLETTESLLPRSVANASGDPDVIRL
jgi:hypothetical protein